MTDDRNLPDLHLYCNGTNSTYREGLFPGLLYSDGVKYIMDNGYAWFVTDALSVICYGPRRVKQEPFLVIKLTVDPKTREARMTMDDGNGKIKYRQKYCYTDAKVELVLWYQNGLLYLPSED